MPCISSISSASANARGKGDSRISITQSKHALMRQRHDDRHPGREPAPEEDLPCLSPGRAKVLNNPGWYECFEAGEFRGCFLGDVALSFPGLGDSSHARVQFLML